MDYIKVTFRLEKPEDYTADLLVAYLGEVGFESFEETTQGVIGYCPINLFEESEMKQVIAELPGNAKIVYRVDTIADQNWNEEWEKNHFKPIEIKGMCCIHSTDVALDKEFEYDIVINPCQSFGTGSHETTRLIVGMLLEMNLEGKAVIDMGCGTGILSIMAALRGAKGVVAIDIDPWSQRNAMENIALNGLDNIEIHLGDASLLAQYTAQLLLANINRNILLNDMQAYAKSIAPEGILIVSGFYKEDLPMIEAKAAEFGLEMMETREENNWVAAQFKKQADK